MVTEGGWFLYRRTQEGTREPLCGGIPIREKEQVLLETSDVGRLFSQRPEGRVTDRLCHHRADRGTKRTDPPFGSLRARPSTRAVRRITVGAHLWQPRLSPDGSILVAVQAVGAASRLVMVDGASGKVAVLYARKGVTVCHSRLSRRIGSRVAFVLQAGGRNDIMVLALPSRARPRPSMTRSPT